ncbi:MAG: pyrroline-5-carboxylate reductase [Solirubrobacterales bacterium]
MIVGFAGSGNIATAMARGWAAGEGGPEQMLFTDSGSGRASSLADEVGGEALDSNRELADRADLLVLAVKPAALGDVAAEAQEAPAVLSLLGATPLARVADAFPGATVLRTMPNIGVELRRGVLVFTAAQDAPEGLVAEVRESLELLGRVVELEDALFDAATAVMGCAPAYLALVMEAIAEAGAADGLDSDLAHSLIADAAAGTAEVLRRHHPAQLRDAVASPGGSTEAGLEVLEEEDVAEAFEDAVRASLARMRE